MAVTVTSKDRFHFALFLALSLHALFILGISFSSDANYQESTSIDVTLSLTSDLVAPDEADFIAATNQLGSGTESEAQEMTTTADARLSCRFRTGLRGTGRERVARVARVEA